MAHDPLDVRAEEAHREAAKDRVKFAAQLEAEDIKWLMSSKKGRRIMRRLLDRAGVWQLSFNTNALTMAFAEGRRNEGLALLARITEHCPARYTEMLTERTDHE
jgi:hypothetical protein